MDQGPTKTQTPTPRPTQPDLIGRTTADVLYKIWLDIFPLMTRCSKLLQSSKLCTVLILIITHLLAIIFALSFLIVFGK